MSETTVLEQLLERIDSLYTLPSVAVEVLHLTSEAAAEDGVDVDRLRSVIERDPALSSNVLRAANNPVFGSGSDVASLTEALRILGPQALKGVILSFSLPEGFTEFASQEILGDYWQRTISRTIAARQCAQMLGDGGAEEVFNASLMADIGVLALARELGDSYLSFIAEAKNNEHDLCEMETASLGFDHRTLSSRLLERWNLPESTVSIVGFSHLLTPTSVLREGQRHAGILFASDLAAELLLDDKSAATPLLQACQSFFGWKIEQVKRWMDQSTELIQDFSDLLDVMVVVGSEYPQLLSQAFENLQRLRATESLADKSADRFESEPTSNADTFVDADKSRNSTELSLDRVDKGIKDWEASEKGNSEFNFFGSSSAARIDEQPDGAFEHWADDPGLLGRVAVAIQNCRMNRIPMSLLLIQIDDFENVVFSESVEGIYRIQQSITVALERLSRDERGQVMEISDDRFALLLPGLDRIEASRLGNSVQQLIRQWSKGRSEQHRCVISLSIGCASAPIPAKNFDPKIIISAAQRCLEGVQLGTGNGLKTIDVY